jgi:hypothetical protein
MSLIMEIAERVTAKSIIHVRSSSGSGAVNTSLPKVVKAGEDGFEIMANVIWAELGKAIMDELGSIVFTVGRPDEFRKVSASSFTYLEGDDKCLLSITGQQRRSLDLLSFSRLPSDPSKRCDPTLCL